MKKSITNLLELSIPERIIAVQDLWDSIAEVPEAVSITQAQKEELDRRLDEYHKNPDNVIPWNDIKKELLSI